MLLSTCCFLFAVGFTILLSTHVQAKQNLTTLNCVHLYEKGVDAYLENRFEDCVENFEDALRLYRKYIKQLQHCRLKCKEDAEFSDRLYPVDIENLLFYEKTIKNTLCIIKCKRNHKDIFENNFINPETDLLFQEQKPYEYLHICYSQIHKLQKAASSAYTYLVAHPDDKIIADALKHYSQLENVDMSEIINYEAKDYVYLYVHGADEYNKKNWKAVIEYMEESLRAYLQSEEECRAQCEGPFDPGWYPDFIPSISNHFVFCLKCKQYCKKKLASLNGEMHQDLLPSHYHYLQYAYFKLGKLNAACQAVANYLLFYADDETMLNNMKYYKKLPKVQDDFFTPTDEAIRYVQRDRYESKLLKFINVEFNFTNPINEIINLKQQTLRVVMNEKQLNGKKRFVWDGLASERECKTMVNLAKMFAQLGDGYDGKKTPHTILEKFEGVTLTRAALLTYFGLINKIYLELYLNLTEQVKDIIVNYFDIKQKLFFSYTQLVCRSALPDSPQNRTDLSHGIHADNCNIQVDGNCLKTSPAYTWRDYSAILYLNNDFDGGEFIFSQDPSGFNIESEIKPKCGRLVAFSSGRENLHGVKAVRRGSRCAIGIWFTHNESHTETDRPLARILLDNNITYKLSNSEN